MRSAALSFLLLVSCAPPDAPAPDPSSPPCAVSSVQWVSWIHPDASAGYRRGHFPGEVGVRVGGGLAGPREITSGHGTKGDVFFLRTETPPLYVTLTLARLDATGSAKLLLLRSGADGVFPEDAAPTLYWSDGTRSASFGVGEMTWRLEPGCWRFALPEGGPQDALVIEVKARRR